MDGKPQLLEREPAVVIAALVASSQALVGALLYILKSFGVDLTADQVIGIVTFVGIVAACLQGKFTRDNVWSDDSVKDLVKAVGGNPDTVEK